MSYWNHNQLEASTLSFHSKTCLHLKRDCIWWGQPTWSCRRYFPLDVVLSIDVYNHHISDICNLIFNLCLIKRFYDNGTLFMCWAAPIPSWNPKTPPWYRVFATLVFLWFCVSSDALICELSTTLTFSLWFFSVMLSYLFETRPPGSLSYTLVVSKFQYGFFSLVQGFVAPSSLSCMLSVVFTSPLIGNLFWKCLVRLLSCWTLVRFVSLLVSRLFLCFLLLVLWVSSSMRPLLDLSPGFSLLSPMCVGWWVCGSRSRSSALIWLMHGLGKLMVAFSVDSSANLTGKLSFYAISLYLSFFLVLIIFRSLWVGGQSEVTVVMACLLDKRSPCVVFAHSKIKLF